MNGKLNIIPDHLDLSPPTLGYLDLRPPWLLAPGPAYSCPKLLPPKCSHPELRPPQPPPCSLLELWTPWPPPSSRPELRPPRPTTRNRLEI